MTNDVLDLRAYNLLLDEERRQLLDEYTPPCDVITAPTHRLDEFIAQHIQRMTILRSNIAYAAMKIKHLKETIGAHEKIPGMCK